MAGVVDQVVVRPAAPSWRARGVEVEEGLEELLDVVMVRAGPGPGRERRLARRGVGGARNFG
ncbi:hypothetical protein [Streptomyces sp. NPDC006012]|uniref:hypothetical protein n=1 Tax=Streptomyces sp. NPDC006012 TaxID=3364739 RepID=UPI0036C5B673